MGPVPHPDRHDGLRLRDEPVPGVATGIEDCIVVLEDAVLPLMSLFCHAIGQTGKLILTANIYLFLVWQ